MYEGKNNIIKRFNTKQKKTNKKSVKKTVKRSMSKKNKNEKESRIKSWKMRKS